MPDDAVIAVDVGNNAYSFGRYFECTAQSVLMSGYLGSIGFGFPAAMGAWAAASRTGRSSPSPATAGSASTSAELTTAVKYGMDITHVLLNNSSWARSPRSSAPADFDVWQTSLHNPDFAAYAELCGAHGIRVDRRRELDDAIAAALAHPGPALVEVIADPDLV